MDKLWAPWRLKYVKKIIKHKGCIFCKERGWVVFTKKHSFCMLNIYPYNNGHLMIVPKKHTGDLSLLNDEELLDLMQSLNLAKKLLTQVLNPQGFNIGINLGRIAGAGFPGHVHVHIVPRWHADTNFMPVVAETKVISQSLEELLRKLKICVCSIK